MLKHYALSYATTNTTINVKKLRLIVCNNLVNSLPRVIGNHECNHQCTNMQVVGILHVTTNVTTEISNYMLFPYSLSYVTTNTNSKILISIGILFTILNSAIENT
jgi:hypothetical protein